GQTRRYESTASGLRAMVALVVLRNKAIKPLLAAAQRRRKSRGAQNPRPIDRHYETIAAVKPQKKGLMLELMHFPEEILDASEFKEPAEKAVGKAEMQMAKQLIESMTSEWKPELYTDEYHKALENMIEEKIEHGGEALPVPTKKKKPTNIVDLVSVLEQAFGRHR